MAAKRIAQGMLNIRESKKRHREALQAADNTIAKHDALQHCATKAGDMVKAWRRLGLRAFLSTNEDHNEEDCKELAVATQLTASELCKRATGNSVLRGLDGTRLLQPGFTKRMKINATASNVAQCGSPQIPKRLCESPLRGESPWKKQRSANDSLSTQLMQSVAVPRMKS
jgi:hypothetical protein